MYIPLLLARGKRWGRRRIREWGKRWRKGSEGRAKRGRERGKGVRGARRRRGEEGGRGGNEGGGDGEKRDQWQSELYLHFLFLCTDVSWPPSQGPQCWTEIEAQPLAQTTIVMRDTCRGTTISPYNYSHQFMSDRLLAQTTIVIKLWEIEAQPLAQTTIFNSHHFMIDSGTTISPDNHSHQIMIERGTTISPDNHSHHFMRDVEVQPLAQTTIVIELWEM